MKASLFLFLITACAVYIPFYKCECDLSIFKDSGIVSDYVSEIPTNPLKVEYKGQSIDCGERVLLFKTLKRPVLSYPANNNTMYTLVMFDPDAPLIGPFLHWLVENIPGSNVKAGNTIGPYIPPGNLPFLKKHRYTLVIYEQVDELHDHFPIFSNNFDVSGFVKSRNLKDPPIAGNLFYE